MEGNFSSEESSNLRSSNPKFAKLVDLISSTYLEDGAPVSTQSKWKQVNMIVKRYRSLIFAVQSTSGWRLHLTHLGYTLQACAQVSMDQQAMKKSYSGYHQLS